MLESEVCVGTSIEWDPEKAGKEIVGKTLGKLKKKPNFFLLFATAHYEKDDGYRKLLNTIYSSLPAGTPLIGGTVFSFSNQDGCFNQGVTAMAVAYENMHAVVGVGNNTKRDPKKAADQCAAMIKRVPNNSKFPKKFIFTLIAGTEIPVLPILGRKNIIRSKLLGKALLEGLNSYEYITQKCFGREQEVLNELTKQFPDYSLLGGSTVDDKMLNNFQFFNNKILKNSVLALVIESDLNFDSGFANGAKESDLKFEVSKISNDKLIVHQINGKPAIQEFLRMLGWSEEFLDEKRWIKRFPLLPIGYQENQKIFLRPFVLVFENSMGFMAGVEKEKAFICLMRAKDIIQATQEVLPTKVDPKFGLMVSCAVRLMTLGKNAFKVRSQYLEYFKDKPFLEIYTAGEYVYKPTEKISYLNESIASTIFW